MHGVDLFFLLPGYLIAGMPPDYKISPYLVFEILIFAEFFTSPAHFAISPLCHVESLL
jgi:hypothetical protein